MVEAFNYTRYTVRLIDEPAVAVSSSGQEAGLPSESFLWVTIILHAISGSHWAEQFVQALPPNDEMHADGAPAGWTLNDLVVAVNTAIFGDEARLRLTAADITTRQGGFVYFNPAFQQQLSECLQDDPAYIGAQAWMLARFDRARNIVEVRYSMHCCTSLRLHISTPCCHALDCSSWSRYLLSTTHADYN
jgi:hypothetical protein